MAVMFRTLALQNGVRIEPIRNEAVGITYEHYVTTTGNGSAVIGPVKHVANKLRRKQKPKDVATRVAEGLVASEQRHLKRLAQGRDLASQLWKQEDEVVANAPRINLAATVKTTGTSPVPPPRRTWRDRLRDKAYAVRNAFFDTDLHKAIQHTAVDIIIWAVAITTVALCAKVLVWAL